MSREMGYGQYFNLHLPYYSEYLPAGIQKFNDNFPESIFVSAFSKDVVRTLKQIQAQKLCTGNASRRAPMCACLCDAPVRGICVQIQSRHMW